VTGTRLKSEPTIFNYGSQGKSQAQPRGGEGHSVITTGYPVTVFRKAVALLRRSNTKARGGRTEIESGVHLRFQSRHRAGLSPLSIISSARILGAYVLKDVCLPREVFHVPLKVACGRKWLRAEQPAPTVWKKSAEGTVAAGAHPGEGPNGARTEQYG